MSCHRMLRALVIVASASALAVSGCAGTRSAREARRLKQQVLKQGVEIGDLRAENKDYEKQVAKAKAEIAKLESELESAKTAAVPPAPAKPATPEDEILLTLDDSTFPPGMASLTPTAKSKLKDALVKLRQASTTSYIRIEGHTDNTPIHKSKARSNEELSAQRALSVLHYLSKAGIRSSKMYVAAYGAHRPIASNDSRAGRAKNRRVVLVKTAK